MKACNRVGLLVVVVVLMCGGTAYAGIITNSPSLPPAGSVYMTPDQIHAEYKGPGLDAVLSQVQHQPFTDKVLRTLVNNGHDEIEQFDSSVSGTVSINGGQPFPVNGTGPVSVRVNGLGLSSTGTFQTEMLSMDLGLGGGVMIRESPTLQSTGQTTVTPIGGGQFHIDSFFDVFTELSLDGGGTWMPDVNAPTHVTLLPEPSTVVLFAAGLLMLGASGRRRRRRAA